MTSKRRELKKTKIEIIPMIDTMFFLLVFFILASLNVIDVKGTQVDLPDSRNQDQQAKAMLAITIKRDQTITINRERVVAPGENVGNVLMQQLGEVKDSGNGAPLRADDTIVVINADRKAPYALVRRCIDEARLARFRKSSIATDPLFGY